MSREVPEGWLAGKFGAFITLQRGFDLPVQDRQHGTFSVIASNGQIDNHSEPKIFGPAVVTGRSGTLGKVFYVEDGCWPLNTTLYVKDFHGNDPQFVTWFLKYFKLERFGTGTGVPTLNRNVVHEEDIVFPPLHEQRRIAEILSSVDDAIAATRAVIEQTKKVKQGVLERLLTKGIGHTRFKQTEIGEIPEGWEVVKLEEITPSDRKITYGIVQAGADYPGGVPYIRVTDMGSHKIEEENILRTSPEIASKYIRSEVRHGDIVFALRGKVGHVLLTPPSLSGANLTQGTARIACGARINNDFLLWALRSPQAQTQYKREIKGSTFQELTLGSLKNISVPLPPLEEQLLLAKGMGEIEVGLERSEKSLQALVEAKSALMSDLLTGRKRVTDALPLAADMEAA
jgi:type I restriction enzyme, S subunit